METLIKYLTDKEQEYLKLAESCRILINNFEAKESRTNLPIQVREDVIELPKGTRRTRVLWFLNNYLKKSSTMPEIERLWIENTGDFSNINMTVRWLKNNGDLVKKSYGSNNATYWGLPFWFDENKNDFKIAYK
jgi:hypothetical protein